jgi:XTP/dITP diphosphohydrolase
MRICFATNNQHKIEEVWHLLSPDFFLLSLRDIGCHEELAETQSTLEGNSLQKAQYVFDRYNVPCFADDSGLEVESLNGAPGVYSARYAGPQRNSDDNIQLLLTNLADKPNRKACFRTIITLVGVNPNPVVFEGRVDGTITTTRKGKGGFGYDSVFVPQDHSLTFAEIELSEKNKLSHRAVAIAKLSKFLLSK